MARSGNMRYNIQRFHCPRMGHVHKFSKSITYSVSESLSCSNLKQISVHLFHRFRVSHSPGTCGRPPHGSSESNKKNESEFATYGQITCTSYVALNELRGWQQPRKRNFRRILFFRPSSPNGKRKKWKRSFDDPVSVSVFSFFFESQFLWLLAFPQRRRRRQMQMPYSSFSSIFFRLGHGASSYLFFHASVHINKSKSEINFQSFVYTQRISICFHFSFAYFEYEMSEKYSSIARMELFLLQVSRIHPTKRFKNPATASILGIAIHAKSFDESTNDFNVLHK